MSDDKLTPDDEGPTLFAIATYRGVVILEFSKPVKWIGLPPDQARAMGLELVRRADAMPADVEHCPHHELPVAFTLYLQPESDAPTLYRTPRQFTLCAMCAGQIHGTLIRLGTKA